MNKASFINKWIAHLAKANAFSNRIFVVIIFKNENWLVLKLINI